MSSVWVQLVEGDEVSNRLLGKPQEIDLVEGIRNMSKLGQYIRSHVAFKDIFDKYQLAPAQFQVYLERPSGPPSASLEKWHDIPQATGNHPLYVLVPRIEYGKQQ